MKALLSPGDKVVVMAPAYQSLYELADATGCSMSFWEPHMADAGRVEYRVQDVLVRQGWVFEFAVFGLSNGGSWWLGQQAS
jgi:hypothetical protein